MVKDEARSQAPIHTPDPAGDGCDSAPLDDGVDVTLVRWMLSLSPAERLQVLQETVDAIEEVRRLNPPRP